MSTVRHGAEKQHLCARWHCMYKSTVMGRESSKRVVAETTEKRRKVNELQEEAGSVTGRSCSRRRKKIMYEIRSLLSEQVLAKSRSFLEAVCGDDGVLVEDLY